MRITRKLYWSSNISDDVGLSCEGQNYEWSRLQAMFLMEDGIQCGMCQQTIPLRSANSGFNKWTIRPQISCSEIFSLSLRVSAMLPRTSLVFLSFGSPSGDME